MEIYDRVCHCEACKYWSRFYGQGIGFCLKNINPDTEIRRVTTVYDFCSLGEWRDNLPDWRMAENKHRR